MRSFLETIRLTRIQLHARTGFALLLASMLPIGKNHFGNGTQLIVIYTEAAPIFMALFVIPALLSGAMLLTTRPVLRTFLALTTIPFLIGGSALVHFMTEEFKTHRPSRAIGYYLCEFAALLLALLCLLQIVDFFRASRSTNRAA